MNWASLCRISWSRSTRSVGRGFLSKLQSPTRPSKNLNSVPLHNVRTSKLNLWHFTLRLNCENWFFSGYPTYFSPPFFQRPQKSPGGGSKSWRARNKLAAWIRKRASPISLKFPSNPTSIARLLMAPRLRPLLWRHLRVFLILLTSICEAVRMLSPTRTELPVDAWCPTHHLKHLVIY